MLLPLRLLGGKEGKKKERISNNDDVMMMVDGWMDGWMDITVLITNRSTTRTDYIHTPPRPTYCTSTTISRK